MKQNFKITFVYQAKTKLDFCEIDFEEEEIKSYDDIKNYQKFAEVKARQYQNKQIGAISTLHQITVWKETYFGNWVAIE
jgi:hypothetical protein